MASNARPRRPWEEGADGPDSVPETHSHGPVTHTEISHLRLESSGIHPLGHATRSRPPDTSFPSESLKHSVANWSQPLHHGSMHVNEAYSRAKRRRTEDYVLSRTTETADFAHREKTQDSYSATAVSVNAQVSCCSAGCTGPQCSSIRNISAGIGEDLSVHELLVHGSRKEESRLPTVETADTPLTLLLLTIRSRLKDSNVSLQDLLNGSLAKKSGSVAGPSSQAQKAPLTAKADPSTATRSPSALPSARAQLYVSEPHPGSPDSSFAPSQPTRLSAIASNMSSSASTCPSNASGQAASATPVPSVQSNAFVQNEVLQDLSHQLSVKTLSHTAMAREYDMLLQKLSRQRVKCAALERKFEVSDAEIVALSTEKERLEDRVECLEQQSQELQTQRDEARKASEDSKAQWMRIVSMAGKLHGGLKDPSRPTGASSAEQSWAKERASLLKRIEQLEVDSSGNLPADEASKARITRLEEENQKLGERNVKLEHGLSAAKAAVITLAAHGQNVGNVLSRALEE